MNALRVTGLLALGLAACESAPPGSEDLKVSDVYEVTLLIGGFVEFEGERIPEELFLLKMRKVLRSVPMDAEVRPGLILRVGEHSKAMEAELTRFCRRAFVDLGSFGLGSVDVRGS